MVNVEGTREKTFNIRFSDEEWERLDRLSSERGINAASLIRMLLKQADSGGASRALEATEPVDKAISTARTIEKIMAPVRSMKRPTAAIAKASVKNPLPKIPKR